MADTSQAPHRLDLVIDFVNTLDLETGADELASADGLARWLSERGVLGQTSGGAPSETDRHEAIRLREALRRLMLANNGGTDLGDAGSELERAARRGDLGIHFGARGAVSVTPRVEGFAGALARLLIPVADAIADGSWQRVKACRSSDCHWAFYDRSRNRSGVWCEMAVCGNRTKVRAYRERSPRQSR